MNKGRRFICSNDSCTNKSVKFRLADFMDEFVCNTCGKELKPQPNKRDLRWDCKARLELTQLDIR